MKRIVKLASVALFAFLIGFGSVAFNHQQVNAEAQKPLPQACNCVRTFECGSISPNCDGRPAMMARKFLSDCILDCGWEEVGCCTTPN